MKTKLPHLMFTTLLIFLPALGQAQQKPAAPAASSTAVAQPGASGDPFSKDRQAAIIATQNFRDANGDLPVILSGLRPCGPARRQAIQSVKDLAFKALTLKAHYYAEWTDLLTNQISDVAKASADTETLRAQLEDESADAQQMLDDLQQRERDLKKAGKSSDVSVEKALGHLDTLMASANARLDDVQRSFGDLDRAQTYGTQKRDRLQAFRETVRNEDLLLEAESGLWDAFYQATQAKSSLDCVGLEEKSFRPFDPERP